MNSIRLHLHGPRRLSLVAGALLTLTLAPTAWPAVSTWRGAGNSNAWTTTANWNTAFTSGNDVVFEGTVRPTPQLTASAAAASVTFGSTAGTFVLGRSNSAVLTVGAGGIVSAQGTQTVNIPLVLGASQTWGAKSGSLVIGSSGAGGTIDTRGVTLTIDGAGDVQVNNQFTGSGSVVKNGTGTLYITDGGNSTFSSYTGTTQVNGGTLVLDMGNSTASPLAGTVTVGDGVGTDQLVTRWRDQIGDSSALVVKSSGSVLIDDGTYSNGTFTETVGSLSLQGGAQINTSSDSSLGLNGNVTHDGTGSSAAVIAGNLALGAATRTFDIANSPAATDLRVTAVVSGGTGAGVTKSGTGTMELAGANTYTGPTSVTGGTLLVSGTVNATSAVSITGGTLALGASERITNSAAVTLGAGGKLQLAQASGTLTENVGALTLTGTGSHVIDFGSVGGVLRFLASNTATWVGRLSVWNWSGAVAGGGTDQLYFGSNGSGLTSAQLASIDFYSDSGTTQLGSAVLRSTGEVTASSLTPVPEPATALSTLLLAGTAFWRTRRVAERGQRGRWK